MVHTEFSDTSNTIAVFGGYVVVVGLVSLLLKDKYFMSEALIAFCVGIAFGPIGANLFNPLDWVGGDRHSLNYLTFQVSRIVIAVQVFLTGAALPKRYMQLEWLSLTTLLFPVMTAAWFYVPLSVRNMLLAEAGANDGLGFPFLFMALHLILIKEPGYQYHTIAGAVGQWFYDILLYQILLSCIIGGVMGYLGLKVLRFAHDKHLIDHGAFLAFGLGMVLFTAGWVGSVGSDDILACFVMGCFINWDDFYRKKNEEDAFQEVLDSLLNTGVFLFIGAVIPWHEFNNFWDISPWRLVVLGILVMLLRRVPAVIAFFIPVLGGWFEAAFAGYFGPIGVGAVFYTQVALERIPSSRERLLHVVLPVVYFLVMTSIIVHGITIPAGVAVWQGWKLVTRRRHGKRIDTGEHELETGQIGGPPVDAQGSLPAMSHV